MRRNTLAFAVVLLGLLFVNPPAADARQFNIPKRLEICHLTVDEQETLVIGPLLAILHLLFHQYDYVGVCDILPS